MATRVAKVAAVVLIAVALPCATAPVQGGQAGSEPPSSATQPAPPLGGAPAGPPPTLQGQPDSSGSALEIAPQPAAPANRGANLAPQPSEPGTEQAPSDNSYQPSDNSASNNPGYYAVPVPGQDGRPSRRLPYLGLSVEYATKCFAGQEERGLEIINIDPNSPASKAGLQSRGDITPLGAAGVTAGALLGPLEMAVVPLLKKSGQLGKDGDLIVAVDDHRIRSETDLEDELAQLKPGDTMYLTVIRPIGNGQHKTMKIAVKVGAPNNAVANAGDPQPAAPQPADQYAY